MKILFLTYNYPPQKFPRSVQISHLVQELRLRNDITVITSIPESVGDPSLLSFTPLDNVKYAEKSKVTKFLEKTKGDRYKKALLPDPFYPWHRDLTKRTQKIINSEIVNTVVTFGQPMSTHVSGLNLKLKNPHIKWIAHFSDPWVDNIYQDYNVWTRRINLYFQNKVFEKADKLIVTSEETAELVFSKYSSDIRKKVNVLPHSFNPKLYVNKTKKDSKIFTIRYLGNFYGNRKPDYLFEALKLFKNYKYPLKVELVGASVDSTETLIEAFGLESFVKTRATVEYIESLALMQSSDLLLILDAPAASSPFLPSKLVDYIGAGKPIFGITSEGASKKLIEKLGFLVADPLNPIEIRDKLQIMIEREHDMKPVIADHFNVKNVAIEFEKILES